MASSPSPKYALPGARQGLRIGCVLPLAALGYWVINEVATSTLAMFGAALLVMIPAAVLIRFRWSLSYLFWLACTVYIFAGMAVYEYREAVYFNFDGDVTIPYNVWLVATAVTALARLSGDFFPRGFVATRFSDIRYSWIVVFTVLGLASAAAIFRSGIPALADDVGLARAAAVEGSKGVFWTFYTSLQLLCTILVVRTWAARRPMVYRTVDVALILLFVVVLSLYGGRFFVFFPLLFAVAYLYSIGEIRLKSVAAAFLALLALSIAVSVSRFATSLFTGGDSLLFIAIRNDLFPEARTLVQMSHLIAGFDSAYFFSPFISFLPSAFYDLVGLDKQDYLLSIGKYLNSFDPSGEDVGYRVTFLGEAYLAFGYAGVAAAVAIINALSVLLNRLVSVDWFSRLYVALFGAMLVPYGVTFVRSSIVLIPLGLLIIRLAEKRAPGHRTPDASIGWHARGLNRP